MPVRKTVFPVSLAFGMPTLAECGNMTNRPPAPPPTQTSSGMKTPAIRV